MYNPTDRIVEACRGQCTNKQSKLMYQVAFYKTLWQHERTGFVKREKLLSLITISYYVTKSRRCTACWDLKMEVAACRHACTHSTL